MDTATRVSETGGKRTEKPLSPCPDGNTIRDIDDEDFLIQLPDSLKRRIRQINKDIIPVFSRANQASARAQRLHTMISSISLISALVAAGIAVIQIAQVCRADWLLFAEAVMILISVGAWRFGKYRRYHRTWLIERHKAERCRFLKYRQVIDPLPKTEFDRRRQEIEQTKTSGDVQQWIETAGITVDNYSLRAPATGPEFFHLVRYYYCVRLNYQVNSFYKKKITEKETLVKCSKFIEPAVFFLTALGTLCHIILDWGTTSVPLSQLPSGGIPKTFGFLVVIIVALLFVIGDGLKTVRVLFAYPQIYVMYRSAYHALMRFERNLSDYLVASGKGDHTIAAGTDPGDPADHLTLMNLYNCEEVMQHEHAVWFGIMDQADLI